MSLDKWLKSEGNKKNSKKKSSPKEQTEKRIDDDLKDKLQLEHQIKLIKHNLVCTSANCKYQKTIIKKQLTDDDKKCPKCNKQMKLMKG